MIDIEIEAGEAAKDISKKFENAGIVKSADIFYFYIKLNNLAPKIQAGKFQIPTNLTIPEVAEIIQKAAGNDIWITIQEGLRTDEIALILDEYFLKEENFKFNKEEFLAIVNNPDDYDLNSEMLEYKPEGQTLEGFLFPDTYNVSKEITSKELVELLLDTFYEKLEEEKLSIDKHETLSAYEVIKLASIIEREARGADEKNMVADILLKRLNGELEGVKLIQADATLLYELKNWEAVITNELKEKDSAYNTYKVPGLPPTPICSPGLDSVSAVMNPESNEYFFYLHDGDGKIHYAKTLSEHTNNIRCFINGNQDYCL